MVIAAVNLAVRTGIIANGLWNVLELIDGVEAPPVVLAEGGGTESQEPIEKIEFSEHYSSSPELVEKLDNSMGGRSLSDQRDGSKVKAGKEMMTSGTRNARKGVT